MLSTTPTICVRNFISFSLFPKTCYGKNRLFSKFLASVPRLRVKHDILPTWYSEIVARSLFCLTHLCSNFSVYLSNNVQFTILLPIKQSTQAVLTSIYFEADSMTQLIFALPSPLQITFIWARVCSDRYQQVPQALVPIPKVIPPCPGDWQSNVAFLTWSTIKKS